MKGTNKVWYSGNVGGKIVYGQTGDNNPACSFSIASEQDGRGTTWARINCYGPLVTKLKGKIKRGAYFIVEGELMNRAGQYGELTEIRAKEVTVVTEGKEEENVTERE